MCQQLRSTTLAGCAREACCRMLAKGAGETELIKVDLPFMREASDFQNDRLKKQYSEARW